jgi:hypothetical protein
MPLPSPRKKEKRSEFVGRCVSELTTEEEFKDPKQRVAVCYDIFKNKEAEASIVIGEGEDTQLFFEESEALQYGKPSKNDPRKTPAPKKDQKKGSDRNPEKSAEKANPSIQFSKETEDQLKNLAQEHNKQNKGSKASLSMLKAVYRRGSGAFSTSHAPNMSRHGWAIARVKAFLYLLKNGRPSNPNYKQDNDLLPKGHTRSS